MKDPLKPIQIYINRNDAPADALSCSSVTEALEALFAYDSADPETVDILSAVPEKSFPAPDYNITPAIFYIGAGVYREKLVISRPGLTMIGEPGQTVIVFGQGAFEIMEDGEKRGTFRTASVRIDAPDFTAKDITFQNDAGFGHTVGQALALYVDADRCLFENCRFLGSQDTLFTAPLPFKEAKPGGFKGPGEFKPRVMGRHLYRECYIQGDVDFIFGSATAWFENCEIFSKMPGDRKPPESPDDHPVYGYVTAASTYENVKYGYVFHNCHLTSDCPAHTVYLGRPWREYAKTVFLHCEMGEHIHPLGWADWNKDHDHFFYAEYKSYGPGADVADRADFSHQLTDEEASVYTMENVLEGWRMD